MRMTTGELRVVALQSMYLPQTLNYEDHSHTHPKANYTP